MGQYGWHRTGGGRRSHALHGLDRKFVGLALKRSKKYPCKPMPRAIWQTRFAAAAWCLGHIGDHAAPARQIKADSLQMARWVLSAPELAPSAVAQRPVAEILPWELKAASALRCSIDCLKAYAGWQAFAFIIRSWQNRACFGGSSPADPRQSARMLGLVRCASGFASGTYG